MYKFKSLSEVHEILELPKPLHPLISLIDNSNNKINPNKLPTPHISPFYKISYKDNLSGKMRYGQSYYDFKEGGMVFVSPNQIIATEYDNGEHSGYTLLIDSNFLLGYNLSKKITQYGFFSYTTNEALHLSESEKITIISIFKIIEEELKNRIDELSQDIIISQIELLLNYSERFYRRQFITRKIPNHNILERLEELLNIYFNDEKLLKTGLPTVDYISNKLNVSPNYLSDMLRLLTGQSTQQHIYDKLIEKAKERLSTTDLSVSEIAYELGFQYSQSFSRLFKNKMSISPLEFRRSFNLS